MAGAGQRHAVGLAAPTAICRLASARVPRRAKTLLVQRKNRVEPLSTDGVYHFAGVMWWGTSMGKRYSAVRRLWFAAAEFAVMSAAVLTVATIAKYGL